MWLETAVLTGVAAGCVHVVTGPDHMAAVAPLAIDSHRRAWRTGLMWGVGHSSGTWILAAVALAFREAIPVNLVSAWSERLVGVVLIGVGLWAIRRALARRVHSHAHSHGGRAHEHTHMHEHAHPHDHTGEPSLRHAHAHGALGIGTLHGLAGTSHILGVLPALALPTRAAAIAYVVAFGLGSILAMTGFAWVCGAVGSRGAGNRGRVVQALMLATSVGAIALGVFWLLDSTSAALS